VHLMIGASTIDEVEESQDEVALLAASNDTRKQQPTRQHHLPSLVPSMSHS
jgi:hypothetical protein